MAVATPPNCNRGEGGVMSLCVCGGGGGGSSECV